MKKLLTFAAVAVMATTVNAAPYKLTGFQMVNSFLDNSTADKTFVNDSISSNNFEWNGSSSFTINNIVLDTLGTPGFAVDALWKGSMTITNSGGTYTFSSTQTSCTGSSFICGAAGTGAIADAQGDVMSRTNSAGKVNFAQTGSSFNKINITVSEVPVPAAAWLFGSALVGLAGVARRRNA